MEILGVRVGDLRSSDMRMEEGKARQGIWWSEMTSRKADSLGRTFLDVDVLCSLTYFF